MIFVSVGTQFGFDRLVQAVDDWQGKNGTHVFAQIADGKYLPGNIDWSRRLTVDEFDERFSAARVIVSHAGMGNIIKAVLQEKPIIVLPRSFALGEHRNDHQLATARKLSGLAGCYIADDAEDLKQYLDRIDQLVPPGGQEFAHLTGLSVFLEEFIQSC